jgi:hypothetical protein
MTSQVSAVAGDTRSVLVIGGQGFLGSFIARAFAQEGWRVTRGGRRAERAADFRLVDLDRPETVDAATRDVDLVVSTVRHPRLVAERAVLRAGPTLINLDDLHAAERARLQEEVPSPKGLVVDRTGLYGVAMLALAELLGRHPEADTVHYGFLAGIAEKSGPAGGALMERLLHGAGRRRTARVRLPDPFGRRRAIEAGADADGILRDVVGARSFRVYVCFVPAAVNGIILALNALGVAGRLPLSALPSGKPPAEPSRQPTCHWLEVRRGRELLASRFVRGNGDYRMSVAATRIFADALIPGAGVEPRRRGVFGVDEILTLAELSPALRAHGITVDPAAVPGHTASGRASGAPAASPRRAGVRS